jgi:aspartate-semialdehyde dehydrogenase
MKEAAMSRIKVGIIGATGMVGQRFVQLLDGHPWFEVTSLAASGRSAGRPYGETCAWRLDTPMPSWAGEKEVQEAAPGLDCELLFSALPGDLAGPLEGDFAAAGYAVSSNASAHRMDADVPLLVPEVNADHLQLIEVQRRERGWGRGFIVTNPNCSAVQLALALKPLQDRFGLEQVFVVTMQGLSGAGYPGVAALDIVDNVLPFIPQEEGKLEAEPQKILGKLDGEGVTPASFALSAQCNRVASREGHLECVSVKLSREASLEEFTAALEEFKGLPQELRLPAAPVRPIVVRREDDRPQPRLDRDEGRGMAVVVGRVRPCPLLDVKFLVLGHNTVRGAAGAAILNAELLVARGYLPLPAH